MRTKGTRRRRALRWSVYAVTLLAIAAIVVSFKNPPTMTAQSRTAPSIPRHSLALSLTNGVLMGVYWNDQPTNATEAAGTLVIKTHRGYFPRAWYAPPLIRGGHAELPLVYPAVLLLVISLRLLNTNRRKIPPGHCQSCRYNLAGLETATCPECGKDARA
jgi:hypothetical protein